MEEKDKLRNALFEKYFEVKEGISAIDFVNHTLDIREKWKELHHMFEENVEYFDQFSYFGQIRSFSCSGCRYFIAKLSFREYVIVDMDKSSSVTKEELPEEMNEEFFIHHFREEKENNAEDALKFYSFFEYDKVDELLAFYVENKELLEMPTYLHYPLSIGDDFTYLSIDLANGNAQLGFRAMREEKQFLYEHLHLVPDEGLSPFGLQDAVKRIGVDKMHEMFARIPTIKLPKEVIPEALYERVSASMENHKIRGPIYSKK